MGFLRAFPVEQPKDLHIWRDLQTFGAIDTVLVIDIFACPISRLEVFSGFCLNAGLADVQQGSTIGVHLSFYRFASRLSLESTKS